MIIIFILLVLLAQAVAIFKLFLRPNPRPKMMLKVGTSTYTDDQDGKTYTLPCCEQVDIEYAFSLLADSLGVEFERTEAVISHLRVKPKRGTKPKAEGGL